MAEFDLSAARAKRSRDAKWLVLTDDGEVVAKYELAPEIPAAALDAGSAGRVLDSVKLLFVHKDEAEQFVIDHQPSLDDLMAILAGCYGIGKPGELLASGI